MYIDGNAGRYLKWELKQNWMPIRQRADLFETNLSANEINHPRGLRYTQWQRMRIFTHGRQMFQLVQLVVFRASALLKCIIMAESTSGQNAVNPVFWLATREG